MILFLKGWSLFKYMTCLKWNPFFCILLSIKQKVSRLWLLKAALNTDGIFQEWDHQGVFSPAALNSPDSMALSNWSWYVFVAVLLCHIHTGQLIEGITCVRQKCFKTSFQIPAANMVLCYHSDRSRVRWTRTELQANDRISPFIHWIPRSPRLFSKHPVNFICENTFSLKNQSEMNLKLNNRLVVNISFFCSFYPIVICSRKRSSRQADLIRGNKILWEFPYPWHWCCPPRTPFRCSPNVMEL